MDSEQRAFLIGQCFFTETDCDEINVLMRDWPQLTLRECMGLWAGDPVRWTPGYDIGGDCECG